MYSAHSPHKGTSLQPIHLWLAASSQAMSCSSLTSRQEPASQSCSRKLPQVRMVRGQNAAAKSERQLTPKATMRPAI